MACFFSFALMNGQPSVRPNSSGIAVIQYKDPSNLEGVSLREGGEQAMSNTTRPGRNDAPICELLMNLPPLTALTEVVVDGIPFAVTSFININSDTNLAYFLSTVGTTLIVDCDSLSQVSF